MDSRQSFVLAANSVNDLVQMAERSAKLADFLVARAGQFSGYAEAVWQVIRRTESLGLYAMQQDAALRQLAADIESEILRANRLVAMRPR